MIKFSAHPPGKSFAMTFVDDTDLSTRENTEPVYDLLADHGFWGTKTVWPLWARRTSAFRRTLQQETPEAGSGSTLQDPEYARFILDLQERGFEIALHGVAAGNSTREEIQHGLQYFQETLGRPPVMNAFHRTNLENLYCGFHKLDSPILRLLERISDHSEYEGHRPGTPSFWGDIAQQTFRYVRLPFHTIDEINTLKVNPSMPFRDPRRPYVRRWFAGSDGADVVRFNRLLSAQNVDRLARDNGACIVYTHFAKSFARKRSNGYGLDNAFVETVKRVTSHPAGWFATATALLDRLAVVNSMTLHHEDRQLVVQNTGNLDATDIVVLVPQGTELCGEDGLALNRDATTAVLPALPPGAKIVLKTNRPGRQVISPRADEIGSVERQMIEYRNYIGLARGWFQDRLYYSQRG